jgi:hypothetical protein
MYAIIYDDPSVNGLQFPFFWTGQGWAHTIAVAMTFKTMAEAEVERWNSAGTDSTIARVES